MKLIDSNKELLNVMQILHQYYENAAQTDPRMDTFQKWLVVAVDGLSDPKVEFRQFGNAIVAARRKTETATTALIWMYSVDTADNAIINLAGGYTYFIDNGVTDFVAVYSDKAVSRIARGAFSKIEQDGDKMAIKETPEGQFVMYAHFDSEAHNV